MARDKERRGGRDGGHRREKSAGWMNRRGAEARSEKDRINGITISRKEILHHFVNPASKNVSGGRFQRSGLVIPAATRSIQNKNRRNESLHSGGSSHLNFFRDLTGRNFSKIPDDGAFNFNETFALTWTIARRGTGNSPARNLWLPLRHETGEMAVVRWKKSLTLTLSHRMGEGMNFTSPSFTSP